MSKLTAAEFFELANKYSESRPKFIIREEESFITKFSASVNDNGHLFITDPGHLCPKQAREYANWILKIFKEE